LKKSDAGIAPNANGDIDSGMQRALSLGIGAGVPGGGPTANEFFADNIGDTDPERNDYIVEPANTADVPPEGLVVLLPAPNVGKSGDPFRFNVDAGQRYAVRYSNAYANGVPVSLTMCQFDIYLSNVTGSGYVVTLTSAFNTVNVGAGTPYPGPAVCSGVPRRVAPGTITHIELTITPS
jgi:hypothetical protein